MTDTVEKPIVVKASQGTLDALYALGRQLVLLLGGVSVLLTLIGTRDFVGIVAWLQSEDGIRWIGVLGTVVALIWGQWKTWRRGAQIATVAASTAVPNSIAKLEKS